MKIRELDPHADARGMVFEPVGLPELPEQKNCHVVITAPGGVRGNHFHETATEIITVTGAALVRMRIEGEIVDEHVPAGEAWQFLFRPGIAHAFKNTGSEPHTLVVFCDRPFDPDNPDTVRDALIE